MSAFLYTVIYTSDQSIWEIDSNQYDILELICMK